MVWLVCLQTYQVDWEAILAQSVEPFIDSVSPWLYPPAAKGMPTAVPERLIGVDFEFDQLPHIRGVLSSARRRLDALNSA